MTKNTHNPEPAGIGDIVVGIDDSPSSRAALDWAAKAARSSGDRLRAVHVLNAALASPLVWTNGFPSMAYVAETAAPEIAKKTMAAMFDAIAPEPNWTLEFSDGSTAQQLCTPLQVRECSWSGRESTSGSIGSSTARSATTA